MFSKIKEMNKKSLEAIIETFVNEPESFSGLINYLDSTDFFYAPAAKKYHDNYPGGLFDHSMGLLDELRELKSKMGKNWSMEDMITIAFGHDVCKVGLYIHQVDSDGYITYDINPDRIGKDDGHGIMSLNMLAQVAPNLLNDRVAKCIVCHMGLWTKDIDNAPQYILNSQTEDDMVFFTHVADMISSRKSRGLDKVKLNEYGMVEDKFL